MRHTMLFSVVLLALSASALFADIALENPRAKLVLNDEGAAVSLLDKASGRECLAAGVRLPLAIVRHSDQSFNTLAARLDAGLLTLTFANTDTALTYRIEQAPDWVVFRLESISGTRPVSLTLLQLPVEITQNVGPRLNCAWDERTAVCLMAANRQVDCGAKGGRFATLSVASQDAPGRDSKAPAAALILSAAAEFKPLAAAASQAFGLLTNEDPSGLPVKDTQLTRGSYWFISFGENEVDQVIEHCEKAGVKQVMMSSGSWCKDVGHYTFQELRFPGGQASLKRTIARLHERGILVGMHCFVSKVSKTDAYVTPIPDKRFWRDRETALAADVTAEQTQITVAGDLSQWPGSPVAKQKLWEGGVAKHQEVILGDEIVQYESIGPEGKWDTFLGCNRGAWGTAAAAHRSADPAVHYGVDGCINGYIIDQETGLMDEVTDRIAAIYNDCDFDMVYFDGGEDVNRTRFNYFVSNFQEQAMKRFKKRPIIHMGTIMTHLLWHSFARSATVDVYLATLYGAIQAGAQIDKWPTVREHIDRSVNYMLSIRQDMMPGELGWFGIWPRGRDTDGLQLDEFEYLMCKSLGYDVPISLETSFSQMEGHVLTPEILNIVREYEQLRMSGAVPDETRRLLQGKGRDFALIKREGQVSFAPVEPLPLVAGTHDVRALVGPFETGSVATLWHYLRDGSVLIPVDSAKLDLRTFSGDPIAVQAEGERTVIPVGPSRNTLFARGISPADLRAALEQAEVRLRKPAMLLVRAADATRLEGKIAFGFSVGVAESGAFGDVLVCTDRPSFSVTNQWYAEYTVDIPHEGRWAVWARVRYPSGADDSFGFVLPHEPVTLSGRQVLGNCGVNEQQWHWTGQGAGSTSVPPGSPITIKLPKGPFTFRIHAREGGGTATVNPRLDLIAFTDDPAAVPTDDDAKRIISESAPATGRPND